MSRWRALGTAAAVAAVLLLPVLRPHPFVLGIATQAVIWALLASSWDLLSGYTGQVSFGHAGFFAVGAYTAAAITSISLPTSASRRSGPTCSSIKPPRLPIR